MKQTKLVSVLYKMVALSVLSAAALLPGLAQAIERDSSLHNMAEFSWSALAKAHFDSFDTIAALLAPLDRAIREMDDKMATDGYYELGLFSSYHTTKSRDSWTSLCRGIGELKTGVATYARLFARLSPEAQRVVQFGDGVDNYQYDHFSGDMSPRVFSKLVDELAIQCTLPLWSFRGPSKDKTKFDMIVRGLLAYDSSIAWRIENEANLKDVRRHNHEPVADFKLRPAPSAAPAR